MQPEPYMALWRRTLFISYACISWVYRWVVTFTILYFLSSFLKPYKLEVISQMLALFALGSMFGWPLVNMVKGIKKRGRLPDMKLFNSSVTACLLATVLLGFFFLPLPVTRVRESGVVKVQPAAVEPVRLRTDGFLKEVHVQEGKFVKKGAVLATFTNQEMQKELDRADAEYVMQYKIVEDLTRQVDQVRGEDKNQLETELAVARSQLEKARIEKEWKQKQLNGQLRLVAPRDGVVMGLPKKDAIGKLWQKSESAVFCQIGNPDKLEVLLPISPDDHDLLRDNLAKSKANGWKLPVIIRIQGRDAETWEGELTELPQAVAKEIPPELSSKGGGPLAVKPTSDPEHLEPQTQVYLVQIAILNPDPAIVPGARAQVKIYNEYRSAAWWTWRAIAKTFDIGLM
jgi:putative peptide zinc metalloprotease protein